MLDVIIGNFIKNCLGISHSDCFPFPSLSLLVVPKVIVDMKFIIRNIVMERLMRLMHQMI